MRLNIIISTIRRYSQNISKSSPSGLGTQSGVGASAKGIDTNVPGLSSRCVKSASEPVGPGASASGDYKVPEYFLYSRGSYHEAEIELAKYRCPQPSALKK